jgi:hypothetical protein
LSNRTDSGVRVRMRVHRGACYRPAARDATADLPVDPYARETD